MEKMRMKVEWIYEDVTEEVLLGIVCFDSERRKFPATNESIYKALKTHDAIKPPNHDKRDDVVSYKDMLGSIKKRRLVDPFICLIVGKRQLVARNRAAMSSSNVIPDRHLPYYFDN